MVRRPGTGLWQSATALGKLQRRYLDAESGQAGYLESSKKPADQPLCRCALKVEERKITEAEWVLSRKGHPGLGPVGGGQANAAYNDAEFLIEHAPAERVVPKGERV